MRRASRDGYIPLINVPGRTTYCYDLPSGISALLTAKLL